MDLYELVGGIIVLHLTPIPWVIYYALGKDGLSIFRD